MQEGQPPAFSIFRRIFSNGDGNILKAGRVFSMTTLADRCLSLLVPRNPECLICRVDTSSGELLLCPRCKSFLYSKMPLLCSLCGKPQEGFFSHCCKLHPLSGALSLGHYEGGLKNLIH